ncbi:DUF2752 domain-containing protein [Mesonia sp.]|uniref:DUF2752 domain-containing protein n=2 Tax=Mesonia sp. TaxID=1960830 RepID=UPI003F9781B7
MEEYMLPCITKQIFHFPCPGCGGQRAFLMLVQADFKGAFLMYPAIYPLVLFALLIFINYLKPFKEYSKTVSYVASISVFSVLISYGIKIFH